MSENLPATQESWDDALPVLASQNAVKRYNAVVMYCKDQLRFGNHYDVLPNDQWKCKNKTTAQILDDTSIKKFFSQSGADALCMAWGIRSSAVVLNAVEQPDAAEPYFAYQIQSNLISVRTGQIVGSAVGSCSSREVKYRYRWLDKAEIDSDPRFRGLVDLSMCKKRLKGWGDKQKEQYQVINPDLGDIQPTIFMMAEKRAYVKAVRRLFGITELFNQPISAIEESLLQEMGANDEGQPPESEGLSEKNIKPGNPAKHRDVSKPVFGDEPPPPTDADSPDKPTSGKVVIIQRAIEKFIADKKLSDEGTQWLWQLVTEKWGPLEEITAPVKVIDSWLEKTATKELQQENLLPLER